MNTFIPVGRIRRAIVVRRLRSCGAVSPETARTLDEAGIFPGLTGLFIELLVKRGRIGRTGDGRYWAR